MQFPSFSNQRTFTSQFATATTNKGYCVKDGTNGMVPRNQQERDVRILQIQICKKRQSSYRLTKPTRLRLPRSRNKCNICPIWTSCNRQKLIGVL